MFIWIIPSELLLSIIPIFDKIKDLEESERDDDLAPARSSTMIRFLSLCFFHFFLPILPNLPQSLNSNMILG
ncbi:MAG: hypothetical protein ACTSR8_05650 [Promethearchaeota archaeon]